MAYQSVNPFSGEVLRTFDQHTDQQMVFINYPSVSTADLPFGGIKTF